MCRFNNISLKKDTVENTVIISYDIHKLKRVFIMETFKIFLNKTDWKAIYSKSSIYVNFISF